MRAKLETQSVVTVKLFHLLAKYLLQHISKEISLLQIRGGQLAANTLSSTIVIVADFLWFVRSEFH